MAQTTTHLGRKIGRLRELRGMKQETLAEHLGISQQAVSKIEQSENVDESTLDRISKALGITSNSIRNFSEEALFNNIQTNSDTATNNAIVNYMINPIEEIQKLSAKKDELYEALLKEKDEKIALLERMLAKLEGK